MRAQAKRKKSRPLRSGKGRNLFDSPPQQLNVLKKEESQDEAGGIDCV